jgi:hypothetical protein
MLDMIAVVVVRQRRHRGCGERQHAVGPFGEGRRPVVQAAHKLGNHKGCNCEKSQTATEVETVEILDICDFHLTFASLDLLACQAALCRVAITKLPGRQSYS